MSSPQALFEQALALQHSLKRTEAFRLYQEAEAAGLDTADLHTNMGILLHDQGHVLDAAQRFRRAIAMDPNCFPAINNLGAVCINLGLATEAIACFRYVIDTHKKWLDDGVRAIGEELKRLESEQHVAAQAAVNND